MVNPPSEEVSSGPYPVQRMIKLKRENDPFDLESTSRMRGGMCFVGLFDTSPNVYGL